MAVLDSFQNYLQEDSQDNIVIQAMLRQGATQMVEMVIDWTPAGIYLEGDEDE